MSTMKSISLYLKQLINSGIRKDQHCVHLFAREWFAFGCALEFDELAGSGADDVHVDVGVGIFGVGEVQDRGCFDDADADGGDFADDGICFDHAGFDEFSAGEGEGDVSSGDRSAACAAIRLYHVPINV